MVGLYLAHACFDSYACKLYYGERRTAFLRASRRPSHHHCVCCRAGRIAQRPFVLEYPQCAKRTRTIRQVIETPLLGYSVVLLSLSCFLLLLWALIILVRIVLG